MQWTEPIAQWMYSYMPNVSYYTIYGRTTPKYVPYKPWYEWTTIEMLHSNFYISFWNKRGSPILHNGLDTLHNGCTAICLMSHTTQFTEEQHLNMYHINLDMNGLL